MAINFPDSPSIGDEFTVDSNTWVWTGSVWQYLRRTTFEPVIHPFMLMGA